MAGNRYAVDFSGLSESIRGFKKERHEKNIQKELDTLVKKREGLDMSLGDAAGKQRQLIADTPEMDQTANEMGLDELQGQRIAAKKNRYNELGGLSPQELQGMSTEAVDRYKARVATERSIAQQRETEDTASAFVDFESMGKDPEVLKDWFNEYQAHKWGLPDGVAKFETSGDSILIYENGKDYSQEGVSPTVLPRQQFEQFAISALTPESTKKMGIMLKEGGINQRVRAKEFAVALNAYGDVKSAAEKLGISPEEVQEYMGMKIVKNTVKGYDNFIAEDGTVKGVVWGEGPKGQPTFTTTRPKQVATKGAAGGTEMMKNLFKLADLTIKGGAKRTEARDKMLTSKFGKEFFQMNDAGDAMIPQIPKIKKVLKAEIAAADKDTEEGRDQILKAERMLSMINETDEQVFQGSNGVVAITQIINKALGDPSQYGEGRLAAPVGIEKPEVGGTLKTRGATKRVGGEVSTAIEPYQKAPATSGLDYAPTTPRVTGRKAKSSAVREGLGMDDKAKAARIKQLRENAKKLL